MSNSTTKVCHLVNTATKLTYSILLATLWSLAISAPKACVVKTAKSSKQNLLQL